MGVDELIDELIDREGGYVNNPLDRGGATCWGITETTARAQGYNGAMRDLPRTTAADIYRRLYWLQPHLDQVAIRAPGLAAELFDTAVNMGPRAAISFTQRALNALNRGASDYPDIAVDGQLGPVTLSALDSFLKTRGTAGERVLIKACDALQGERYLHLAEQRPANEAFLYGWLSNRIG